MSIPKMNAKPKKKALTPSQIDFNEELKFAKRFVKGEVEIEDYPYYKSYLKTIKKEKVWLKDEMLVVGVGPFPITMLLLGEGMDGIDQSAKALRLARPVLCRLSNDFALGKCKAEKFPHYRDYESILLTLEAGTTQKKKQDILNNIHSQLNEGTVVIVRSSNTPDFIDVNIDKDKWNVLKVLNVFDGLSKSYVIKKK